jgi:serine/threonine protein kinase
MDLTTNVQTKTVRHSAAHRHATHLGKWELLAPVGEGEWSTVFRARPRDCPADWPADYAIKIARASGTRSCHAQTLIKREATIGRVVIHPHLIAVLSAQTDTAPHYLVMPLLQGATLRAALETCGPLPTPQALWIVRQIAGSLSALHQAGWIHADVKPGNIHVSPQGHATLIDLGFALRLDSSECAPGATLRGTMKYTAPEMISSAVPVDDRSDIYSLGITLYELLTGQPPFTDEDPGRLMLAHLQRAVPNPRRLLPGLHREVSHLLCDLLAKEPLRRPNAAELSRRLVDLEIATLEERVVGYVVAPSDEHADELVDDQIGDVQGGRSGW